jgi:hypothetical protein
MVIPVFDTEKPPDPGNGRIRSKEETHPSISHQAE